MPDLNPSDACLSDLSLDQLLTRELNGGALAQVHAHLERCPACRTRHDDFAARGAAYLAQVPSFAALAERAAGTRRAAAREQPGRVPPVRSRKARVYPALLGLAAAAAAVLAARGVLSGPAAEDETATRAAQQDVTQEKGAPDLGYYVKRGQHVVRGEPGQPLRPGDRLRFTYSSARAQQFALFNRDGHGASVYFPTGPRSAALAAGTGVALDFGVELDDYVGREQVLALFCEQPFELEPLRQALARGEPPSVPADCTLRTIELKKEPAP